MSAPNEAELDVMAAKVLGYGMFDSVSTPHESANRALGGDRAALRIVVKHGMRAAVDRMAPEPGEIQRRMVDSARRLRSEHGENPEYDRALVELCADTLPTLDGEDYDTKRERIRVMVLARHTTRELAASPYREGQKVEYRWESRWRPATYVQLNDASGWHTVHDDRDGATVSSIPSEGIRAVSA